MLCDICKHTKDGPGVMRLERAGEFHGIATLKEDGWHIHRCASEPGRPAAVNLGKGSKEFERPAKKRKENRKKQGKWCLGPESNQRHADFQSAALPTELPRPPAQMAQRGGFIGACGPPVQQGKQVRFGTPPPHATRAEIAIRSP